MISNLFLNWLECWFFRPCTTCFSMILGICSTIKNFTLDFNCHGYKISQVVTNCIFLLILSYFTKILNIEIVRYNHMFTQANLFVFVFICLVYLDMKLAMSLMHTYSNFQTKTFLLSYIILISKSPQLYVFTLKR